MALILISCNGQRNDSVLKTTAENKINIESELKLIEETRSKFSLAIKEGRYHDLGQWLTPDAKTVRPGGPGFDAMFALGKERGKFPYDSIIMSPTETHLLNDSMAYDWGSSRTYYTDKEGKHIELKNSFLVILKKIDGKWKLHREVASSVLE